MRVNGSFLIKPGIAEPHLNMKKMYGHLDIPYVPVAPKQAIAPAFHGQPSFHQAFAAG
jgi:hypothetical protein